MVTHLHHSGASSSPRGTVLVALAMLALSTAPATWADDGDAVALINGHPIAREELVDVLIDAHGIEVLQQLFILQVAKQETRKRGIGVTQADVDAEFQSALDRIAANAGMSAEEATDTNKREALRQVLDERGISMAEFMIGMERNAHLRKLVEKDLHITEETLREEFERRYGARVVVRHIQVLQRDSRGLNQALELLARGSDFADVARQLSKNPETAARGGEMEPFAVVDSEIPAALREAAFSLKEGGVSNPVLAGQFFHILKLERRIPADQARFEDKRAELEESIRARAIPQAMATLATELFKEAKVTVLDSKLRPKYQEFLERGAAGPAQP
jgi:foldase protein PrsA